MTALAQEILYNLDQLPNAEQLAIAQEILKRLMMILALDQQDREQTSQTSIDFVWNNLEDDIYAQLLST